VKEISKTETEKRIKEFFKNIKKKHPKQIRKIKKLAMKHNIKLGELRKKFCKKCFFPYNDSKVRIKKKNKIITCGKCGYISRWKIKD
jgi:RNase P subunit RPR2